MINNILQYVYIGLGLFIFPGIIECIHIAFLKHFLVNKRKHFKKSISEADSRAAGVSAAQLASWLVGLVSYWILIYFYGKTL